MTPARACPVCGEDLVGRRPQARYCSGACRAEASRLRRLLAGSPVDGFASIMDREARMRPRNRTDREHGARARLETRRREA
jgi:hypothetical protein